MPQARSYMEKAIRSAIQRHLRGWAPYPHVRVVETTRGHEVHWHSPTDMFNPNAIVSVATRGKPAKSDFQILSVKGERQWGREDMHIMDSDERMNILQVWAHAVPQKSVGLLCQNAAVTLFEHLRVSFKRNIAANHILDLVHAQRFEPVNALHTALDALALGCTYDGMLETKTNVATLARIFLGYGMQSERGAWACAFAHPEGKWKDMTMVIWNNRDRWNLCIGPINNPTLYSDYVWTNEDNGWTFADKVASDMPDALFRDIFYSRGSYERFLQSKHRAHSEVHFESMQRLLQAVPAAIEPDTAWTNPIVAAQSRNLARQESIAPEYYSLMRSFEQKAFDYLSSKAQTAPGQAMAACMLVERSLEEEPKNLDEWRPRLAQWCSVVCDQPVSDMVGVSHLFESIEP